jgi:hypothetical protein
MFYHVTTSLIINPSHVIDVGISDVPERGDKPFHVEFNMINGDMHVIPCAKLEEAEEELEEFKDFTLVL